MRALVQNELIEKDQLEINRQDYERTNKFLILSTVVYALWFIVDWYVIYKSWLPYCAVIRLMPATLYFLILRIPKETQEKNFHLLNVTIYILGFTTLFPLYFQTDHYFFYYTCSFIVPVFSPTCLVLRPRIQAMYPLLFCLNIIVFRDKVFALPTETLIFSVAYAFSIFVLAQLVSWVEFKNRIEKLNLTRNLAHAVKEKSSLVRILVHDIGNPLTILLHRVDFLKRGKDFDEKTIKSINSIENATNSILAITNKVREMEMQKDFDVHLDLSDVQVVSVLGSAKESFEFRFEEKEISLKLEIDIPQNLTIKADEIILKENVISNLLSNALKFSKTGQTVVLGAKKENQHLKIFVKDEGEGIPFNFRDKIFEGSIKTSLLGTSGESGSGFGLPIAKLFTEKMGGKLEFTTQTKDEKETSGSEFSLYFPL